ncbi:estradiol 17-beta-dehydrogenase 11-like isoform X5 [Ictidomys tridecemlineatus]
MFITLQTRVEIRSLLKDSRKDFSGRKKGTQEVKTEIGDISILVNNAGIVYTSDLFSTQDPQIEKTFAVNTLAHFWTTKAFLPLMMMNNHGHIVTVASAAGLVGVPFLQAYCSSKFAAVGFHGALTEELNAFEKNGIKTTCLCPNFINTGFIKNPSSNSGSFSDYQNPIAEERSNLQKKPHLESDFAPFGTSCFMHWLILIFI